MADRCPPAVLVKSEQRRDIVWARCALLYAIGCFYLEVRAKVMVLLVISRDQDWLVDA